MNHHHHSTLLKMLPLKHGTLMFNSSIIALDTGMITLDTRDDDNTVVSTDDTDHWRTLYLSLVLGNTSLTFLYTCCTSFMFDSESGTVHQPQQSRV